MFDEYWKMILAKFKDTLQFFMFTFDMFEPVVSRQIIKHVGPYRTVCQLNSSLLHLWGGVRFLAGHKQNASNVTAKPQ